ncbi:prolipoprotein diacylglyceryl transferase [Actinomycetospora straminea]|uniref:prolipoprotein diacylglyceryl transferase n=1 Tax=Actinomycetospora straminea TaxID=663607 RepID=UPI00236630CA|nr:prolipoprotein diacylglyceryl transferase [Actinomycetospora straminea]MDD7932504.1 prolipoprotein diacylglyceryl transferase [Actinomycetospora straminea]
MLPAVQTAVTALPTYLPTYLPSPPQGVWQLGPVPLRAYALCIIAGIVVAILWTERRFVARGGEPGTVTDIAVFAVPFGLVGGRLYHVATDWPTYFGPGGNPIAALYIWQGGLGIWGAIALGGVGAWIGCRRRGVPLTAFADAAAPGIVTAQAIGRLGNWFNQELYGAPTTLPWGLELYRRVDPSSGLPDNLTGVALDPTPVAVVHPTFLYELLWNLAVAALVVWADRRFRLSHGRAFALYVAGYTAGRFVIELMRTDPATRVFGDVRINVVVAAVVFAGAVAYLVWMRGRPREVFGRAAEESGRDGDPVDGTDDGTDDGPATESSPDTGSGHDDPGTSNPVTRNGSTGDPDEDQRSENEAQVRSSERSPASAPGGKGGAANPSSVDAEPDTPDTPAGHEDAPAEPPSAAKS